MRSPSGDHCTSPTERSFSRSTLTSPGVCAQASPAAMIGNNTENRCIVLDCKAAGFRSGRDGQIRTADLSLRRRPLYPSELRPHTNFIIVASEALCANVAPVMHPRKVNGADAGISVIDRLGKVAAGCGNAQHAP